MSKAVLSVLWRGSSRAAQCGHWEGSDVGRDSLGPAECQRLSPGSAEGPVCCEQDKQD